MIERIFEVEILTRTLPTTLPQIVCKIIIDFQVIDKNIKDPVEHFKVF